MDVAPFSLSTSSSLLEFWDRIEQPGDKRRHRLRSNRGRTPYAPSQQPTLPLPHSIPAEGGRDNSIPQPSSFFGRLSSGGEEEEEEETCKLFFFPRGRGDDSSAFSGLKSKLFIETLFTQFVSLWRRKGEMCSIPLLGVGVYDWGRENGVGSL